MIEDETRASKRRFDKINAREAELQLRGALRLMDTYEGRTFAAWLLTICHVGQNPFAGEATHQTAFSAGELNIGLQIQAFLSECAPQRFLTLLEEQANVNRERDAANTSDESARDSTESTS